jgi:hypothetical protein
VSESESPSGVSPATPQGSVMAGAGNLGNRSGWRGGVGRAIAYVTLGAAALAIAAAIAGIIWLSV